MLPEVGQRVAGQPLRRPLLQPRHEVQDEELILQHEVVPIRNRGAPLTTVEIRVKGPGNRI